MRIASLDGVEGLTLGDLATRLQLSKSGLFAHFRSKENLQIEVLRAASERFVERVVRPAITLPRGEPRVVGLFERWLDWAKTPGLPGGCIFISAAVELDDRPGPVRDAVVQAQRDWGGALARAARIAVEVGHFRGDLDPEQFAFEQYALLLGYHHHARLLGDPLAEARVRRAFEGQLRLARAPASAS